MSVSVATASTSAKISVVSAPEPTAAGVAGNMPLNENPMSASTMATSVSLF